MERDFPAWWLEEVDQLFTAGDDWYNNACLNYLSDNWLAYLIGYKKAGDALVEHVIQNRRDQDGLVFPAIFLYRQYLELRLKQLIRDGSALLDEHADFPKSHRLDDLWAQCKAVLKRVWPDMSDEDPLLSCWESQAEGIDERAEGGETSLDGLEVRERNQLEPGQQQTRTDVRLEQQP